MSNFWIPKTGEELQNLASILTNNDRERLELMRCHAWFGHFFDGHLGKVQANTSVIQGKPALLSDTLVGICYQYGLVRRLSVVESTATHCTVEAERNDEPVGEVHRFTFTWEMAQRMNLVRANWNKQPANMLKKRARAFICREVFPEAISGLYTVDEMADYAKLPDHEIEMLQARSTGFEDYQASQAPSTYQQVEQVQQVQQVQQAEPQKKTELINNDLDADLSREYHSFKTEDEFYQTLEQYSINIEEARSKMKNQSFDLEKASPNDRRAFFYECLKHDVIRRAAFIPRDWLKLAEDHAESFNKAFVAQYPILENIPYDWYINQVNYPAFAEMLELTKELTTVDHDRVLRAMKSHSPNDWRLFDYVESIVDEYESEDDPDVYQVRL